jgi:DNA-directed RNA polymerase II subunit RPB2
MFEIWVHSEAFTGKTKIMINGNWVAFTKNPTKIMKGLREQISKFTYSYEYSIIRDMIQNEIRIYSDEGRCMRPLFIVENNRLKITEEII